uniref:Uncharacterized protein n=1 Tax=Oryza sativa subsp. japonica TaxID=39947 RepID=Q65X48_ORYSJ|nr:hypothetical protein [Oryza sativa Japonica Group]
MERTKASIEATTATLADGGMMPAPSPRARAGCMDGWMDASSACSARAGATATRHRTRARGREYAGEPG